MTRRNAKDGNYGRRHGRPSSRNRQRARRLKEAGFPPRDLAGAIPVTFVAEPMPPDVAEGASRITVETSGTYRWSGGRP